MRSLTLAALMTATALPAMAEVNIYSYRQPELIQPLLDAFTEETGIETNVAFIDKGLTERLQAEGDRSPADVIMTVDISRLADAKDAGVTQPVESEVLNENIPESLRDSEGHWFGLTTRARIVYASKERVGEDEVTTYEDLADPKWEGRICTRSGTHVYTLGLISALIEHNGAEATEEWLEGVKSNLARAPQGNDRAQVRAIWAGECDISLGNTYYMGKMLEDEEQQEWANAVRIEMPEFEDGSGTHVNISGVAMAKSAPNPEDARAFIEFLSSPEAQAVYARDNYEYPVDPDTPATEQVQEWGDLNPDLTALDAIAENRTQALQMVERVDFDG
ncbi:iron(III) transport system substrate-binding protein [Palleronia salina]|mgnify:CR=1 FL=1|uniref:Iron(III) transport system substrate-binding protein n=2 Tax=Palleronia TaxID=315422 RepID=A0A1M6HV92_9RHOB|nr:MULTISPECIES: Fe(3+) ABC transporter substrate-binding protein [Palleronia]SEM75968.1 iron(III) transport system substrate-binding protein [Palleronia pelagia]SHJ26017.1 iron(III) transport system substrate-binding protein [Palleronia salina]